MGLIWVAPDQAKVGLVTKLYFKLLTGAELAPLVLLTLVKPVKPELA